MEKENITNKSDRSEINMVSKKLEHFLGQTKFISWGWNFLQTIALLTMWSVILNFSRRGFEVIALTILSRMGMEFSKMKSDINKLDDTLLKIEFPETKI